MLSTAVFSAGDARFLQPVFDEIKYRGVKRCEIGAIILPEETIPSIRVTYNSKKLSYKGVVGAFWRACDPTAGSGQFGVSCSTIVWVDGDEQRAIAEQSRERLNLATQFTSNTFGPMFKGRPIQTEIRTLAGYWDTGPDADQNWYLNEPKAYEQARKKSGRARFFEDEYKPVTVTACQKIDEKGGVCGFVYFPCSDENGCTAVMNGNW